MLSAISDEYFLNQANNCLYQIRIFAAPQLKSWADAANSHAVAHAMIYAISIVRRRLQISNAHRLAPSVPDELDKTLPGMNPLAIRWS